MRRRCASTSTCKATRRRSSSMSEPLLPVELSASLTGAAGAPVLVLGNSLGTTAELWQPQLGPLGPYSIADLGTDVLRLLDRHETKTERYCGSLLGGVLGRRLEARPVSVR